MDRDYYPFTCTQYLKLLDAVKNHKKILFTGAPRVGKTYSMYRLVSMLKQDTAEQFSVFEMENEAEAFGLASTILPEFGAARFPQMMADSEFTTRVFSTIRPMYAYGILAICKERDGLIASVPCRYHEFAKKAVQDKLGLKFAYMAEDAFDLCVHIKQQTDKPSSGQACQIIYAEIYDYKQLGCEDI